MLKHHINKAQKGNNGLSKAKQKPVVKAKDENAECTVSSGSAGGQADNAARMARLENSEVVLSVPAAAQPKSKAKELAHPTVPVAAQPKDFVDGFLPVKSVKPEDGFLPVKSEFLATIAGLLPRIADQLAMDVILLLPDIPLIHKYILWHPPVEGLHFQLMPVEVWQTETGANANILFNSFRLTGMPPPLWKTRYKILPPLEIDEV